MGDSINLRCKFGFHNYVTIKHISIDDLLREISQVSYTLTYNKTLNRYYLDGDPITISKSGSEELLEVKVCVECKKIVDESIKRKSELMDEIYQIYEEKQENTKKLEKAMKIYYGRSSDEDTIQKNGGYWVKRGVNNKYFEEIHKKLDIIIENQEKMMEEDIITPEVERLMNDLQKGVITPNE